MRRIINTLWLAQLVSRAIRFMLRAIPWLWGAFTFMLGLIATSAISFWRGIPDTADRLANHWVDRAYAGRFESLHIDWLYNIFFMLAFVMLVLGWVILAALTLGILRVII